MKKVQENIYGIKEGDIFCYKFEFVTYFQVVALRGEKQVVVRQIESKNVTSYEDDIASYEEKVVPNKDKFTETTFLLSKIYGSSVANTGFVKTVSLNENNEPQLGGFKGLGESCVLWDGKSNISSNWGALCR